MIVDFHTHPMMIKELLENSPDLSRAVQDVFGLKFPAQPLSIFLLEMNEAQVDRAVLLPLDCTSRHNCVIVSNEQVAELCDKHPEFIGFASVDPGDPTAVKKLEHAVKGLGLQGLKLNPALQGFEINDQKSAYAIYQVCVELDIPVLIHCGLCWAPSSLARYAHPLLLEEVVQAFPTLKIVIAHFAWPWVNEAVMLALKYPNVYLDTAILYSGTPSNAYQDVIGNKVGKLVLERSLREKVIFGSNYPRVDIRRSVHGINDLNLSPELCQNIFYDNACRILDTERSKV
jgi:predicted TIM-barrel fold metal-dependent hydrolase